METILGFIGFSDIRSIVIEPTFSAPDRVEKTIDAAAQHAKAVAAGF